MGTAPEVVVRDLGPGLWIWRIRHPGWAPDADWQPIVTSTFVESGGETYVVDPVAPPESAKDFWKLLDRHPPKAAVVTLPWHVRDVDKFVGRYGIRAYGPRWLDPDDIPKVRFEPLEPDKILPGGIVALYDGRGRLETPLWLPEQKVIVFADTFTEREGQLRVWASPWHEKRALPALREMLQLPFERIVISHCDTEPVLSREDFVAALALPHWKG